jgi:hypothetical protein
MDDDWGVAEDRQNRWQLFVRFFLTAISMAWAFPAYHGPMIINKNMSGMLGCD